MLMSLGSRVMRKLVRIVEGPPVRERTVVRVVDDKGPRRFRPGFIIGVYRSGTTLLRYILDSHPNIAVPPETNFLEPLASLWTSEWNRKGLQGVGVDAEGLKQRLRDFAASILDDYAVAKGKKRWFDKTPSYIDILDVIEDIFGKETQYILVFRHGLDVAESLASVHAGNGLGGPVRRYMDEYGDVPRLAALRHWVSQCEKMLAFGEKQAARCFTVRYEEFATAPERCLPALFDFIREPWDHKVLDFASASHDFGLQDHKILDVSGFRPSTGNYKLWSKSELSQANNIAGDMLARLKYEF